jgi:hypothetical protein
VRHFGEPPVFLYVGRIAIEKNLKAFLDLRLPGRKVLVGDGPQRQELESLYPDAMFTGPREKEDLAEAYASADVFVFPSLTDTFGLVLVEALASGLPVAAFPVGGPKDVLTDPRAGVLSNDLEQAALKALSLDRKAARAHARTFSWENSARQFLENVLASHSLAPAEGGLGRAGRRGRTPKKKRPGGGDRVASLSCVSLGDALGELASSQRWKVHPSFSRGSRRIFRAFS